MVDVPHDRDHGRPRLEIGLLVLEALRLELFLRRVLDPDLATELGADDLEVLVCERLGCGPHLAECHQDLDEVRHRDPEGL